MYHVSIRTSVCIASSTSVVTNHARNRVTPHSIANSPARVRLLKSQGEIVRITVHIPWRICVRVQEHITMTDKFHGGSIENVDKAFIFLEGHITDIERERCWTLAEMKFTVTYTPELATHMLDDKLAIRISAIYVTSVYLMATPKSFSHLGTKKFDRFGIL
jgi:hypothetical protein